MATKFVPFTVHIKVIPARPGKRWEYIRALQKMSVLVYDQLIGLSGFQFATPGGGQSAQFSDIEQRGGLGDMAAGCAIKPQIGAAPAQLMITGFYQSSAANIQPYANSQRISGGTVYSGPGAHTNDAIPVSTINSEVKTMKAAIKAAVTAGLPAGTTFQIFRIDYSGIVFGDKGFHFPQ
jgi:hypothetical protein